MSKVSIMKNASSILIYLLPVFIISGNFLADLSVVIINVLFIAILIQKKSINFIYNNKYFWILVFFYLYLVARSIFTLEWISIKPAIFSFRYVIFIFAFYYLYINQKRKLQEGATNKMNMKFFLTKQKFYFQKCSFFYNILDLLIILIDALWNISDMVIVIQTSLNIRCIVRNVGFTHLLQ